MVLNNNFHPFQLAHGADPTMKNQEGQTPLDLTSVSIFSVRPREENRDTLRIIFFIFIHETYLRIIFYIFIHETYVKDNFLYFYS